MANAPSSGDAVMWNASDVAPKPHSSAYVRTPRLQQRRVWMHQRTCVCACACALAQCVCVCGGGGARASVGLRVRARAYSRESVVGSAAVQRQVRDVSVRAGEVSRGVKR